MLVTVLQGVQTPGLLPEVEVEAYYNKISIV